MASKRVEGKSLSRAKNCRRAGRKSSVLSCTCLIGLQEKECHFYYFSAKYKKNCWCCEARNFPCFWYLHDVKCGMTFPRLNCMLPPGKIRCRKWLKKRGEILLDWALVSRPQKHKCRRDWWGKLVQIKLRQVKTNDCLCYLYFGIPFASLMFY